MRGRAQVIIDVSRTDFTKVSTENPACNEIVKREVDRMLEASIISQFESLWTSTILLATKSDESPRFFIDFPKLNAVITATNSLFQVLKRFLTLKRW